MTYRSIVDNSSYNKVFSVCDRYAIAMGAVLVANETR